MQLKQVVCKINVLEIIVSVCCILSISLLFFNYSVYVYGFRKQLVSHRGDNAEMFNQYGGTPTSG